MSLLKFFTKTRKRLVFTTIAVTAFALVVWVAISLYANFWTYYRLYYTNTVPSGMTHQERVDRLAAGGFDALPVIVMQLRKLDPTLEKLSMDALETMHRKDKDFLFSAMRNKDRKIAQCAVELITSFAIRAVERPQDGRSMYYNYEIDKVISTVEQYTKSDITPDDGASAEEALLKLREYEKYHTENERYRKFRRSLPQAIKLEVKKRLAEEQKKYGPPQITKGIEIFDEIRRKYPSLSEEQLFEVASILGNVLDLNARYFMLYKNGIPEKGGVVKNPGFHFRDTRDNIPDQGTE
jgi:hypothetical protein